LKCLQGGRVHPLAACGVATLCCSPPELLGTETASVDAPPATERQLHLLTASRVFSLPVQSQKEAIRDLFPRYGLELEYGCPLDVAAIFGAGPHDAPTPRELVLEVGFGNGDALVEMATAEPQRVFVGVEWHRASVGNALVAIHGAPTSRPARRGG
jgi:hypothetical protein